ncbi:hypothetical protein [Mucilaginibacter lutimaris]|uniref:hypothetical protein n=1 Tax=Mucilaginibacter lutimaris TaxID=931629 RepID=UPI00366DFB6C
MRKRKKLRRKMGKWFAKNGKHLSKTERWMCKLFILKLKYPQVRWMRLLIKFALRIIPPDSRPGLLIYYIYGNK